MWPWGHLAVGYLAYAGLLDRRFRQPPGEFALVALAVGTQFPDLVDKPLAWHLGALPNGRSLAHSALVATVLVGLVWVYCRRRDRPAVGVAFGLGYSSHLAADALAPLLEGRVTDLAFLAWPILPGAASERSHSIVGFFVGLARALVAGDVPALFVFELGLVVVALGLWVAHGRPGVGTLRRGAAAIVGRLP